MQITGSDIHLLTVFDAVVRNGGFSAAQVELGLSQPTISNHITALEQRLGVTLCQRGRRGFLVTEKGLMVHEIAKTLIETLGTHSGHLAALKGNLVGRLKIAVLDCVATDPNFRLPQAIARFSEAAPAVRIELGIARPQDIVGAVLDGTVHVGIGSFDNILSGLRVTDLYHEDHALYCGAAHPFFGRSETALSEAEITAAPWVHRGYWSRQRRKAVNPTDLDRFADEIEAQLILILSGAYIGLLPLHMAEGHVAAGRLRRLAYSGEDYTCPMQMLTRAGQMPQVNALFTQILAECYG
ncbi:LysR family transcriptional regulator [Roseovarius nanhaiticus]|uniref:LysR family transcriptional regulator n=1 Tax=Roseovarius nanhaiticus TaxID=573024 RepID=UPI00249160CC|nr:LysR family transcriptional regulator [Roseovarius nanhaiticus]